MSTKESTLRMISTGNFRNMSDFGDAWAVVDGVSSCSANALTSKTGFELAPTVSHAFEARFQAFFRFDRSISASLSACHTCLRLFIFDGSTRAVTVNLRFFLGRRRTSSSLSSSSEKSRSRSCSMSESVMWQTSVGSIEWNGPACTAAMGCLIARYVSIRIIVSTHTRRMESIDGPSVMRQRL